MKMSARSRKTCEIGRAVKRRESPSNMARRLALQRLARDASLWNIAHCSGEIQSLPNRTDVVHAHDGGATGSAGNYRRDGGSETIARQTELGIRIGGANQK